VTVCDEELVGPHHLGSNFYLREEHIGKAQIGEACIGSLKTLNEYVEVVLHKGPVDEEFLKGFDVVCFTNCYDRDLMLRLNKFCRSQEKPIGFIWTGANLGLYGNCFVDFGDAHVIFDKDGEECHSTIITSISNDENGVVVSDLEKRHGFSDDDYVQFREVEGMTELNDQKFKIKVLNPYAFTIGDTRNFGVYTGQGIAEQVKVPFPMKFNSLEYSLETPLADREMIDADQQWDNLSKPYQYHFIFRQLLEFCQRENRLPALLDQTEAEGFETQCNKALETLKAKVKELGDQCKNPADQIESLPEKLSRRLALFARCQLTPFSSFWGGIVAQEIIKYTGKYGPIRQWFHYEIYSQVLPSDDSVKHEVVETSRYRDQIALFGNQVQSKLQDLKVFMIGAGALGCEFLKQFALMGLCCGQGELTVTDDDTIEVSNLNRQFLFRKEHVKSAKATTSMNVAKGMNPNLNGKAVLNRVSSANEHIFTDSFWDSLDMVFGAVDNIHARNYVDSKCVSHKKHLFESGTLGSKCNSQVVIPKVTQSYTDSIDPEEKGIPMCTIRNTPFLLEHCIEWSRNYFSAIFVDGSLDFRNYIKNPENFIKTQVETAGKKTGPLLTKFETMDRFLTIYMEKITLQSLVNFARQIFQDIFHDQIVQLLHCFPRDYVDKEGNKFWSSPKRPPHAIVFDVNDEMNFTFIKSICTILSSVFAQTHKFSDEDIKKSLETAAYTVHSPVTKEMNIDAPFEDVDDHKLSELVLIPLCRSGDWRVSRLTRRPRSPRWSSRKTTTATATSTS
jgi:ubiquitin-activating enzyme E1